MCYSSILLFKWQNLLVAITLFVPHSVSYP